MQDILFEYELNPTTWAYLSALLTLGIYFKFHRFWSVRNLDLVGLIFFSPGILMVFHGLIKATPGLVHLGYWWLFGVGAFFVVRLFLDPIMVRRPLLEPNLNASGLTFTGTALLVFLVANILASDPPLRLERVLAGDNASVVRSPGYAPFYHLASFANARGVPSGGPEPRPFWSYPPLDVQIGVSRTVAVVALLALVLGIVTIGYRHFGSIHTGVAAASLFLLVPYTGQMIGRIDHMVPGAILVWTMAAYRRPLIAGILMSLVGGLIFYPLFLLPLWCSFYLRRGLLRFVYGAAGSLVVMVLLLWVWASNPPTYGTLLKQMFGSTLFAQQGAAGFWNPYDPAYLVHAAYRIPVVALFIVMAGSLALWPAQKNLGTLLSCSATVMLASQFIHAQEGGLYMAWYLPLLVLTVFRPNLEDRVALSAVIEGRSTWPVRLMGRWRKRTGTSQLISQP